MRLYNILFIFFNILTLLRAQIIEITTTPGDNVENQTEDMDTVVTTSLFSKINWLIGETLKVNTKLDALEHRLITQENLIKKVQRNQNSFKAEMRDIVQNQSLKYQKMLQEMQEDLMKGFENLLKHHQAPARAHPKESQNEIIDIKALKQNRNWTVILRRQNGSEDFYRPWSDYKKGFGNSNGEFFIGLEKLHAMTAYGDPQELLIILEDFDNQTRYARYDDFAVGSEDEKYKLTKLGHYSGDAGDSLRLHLNAMFSTKDRDNDEWNLNCAEMFKGAWWFVKCFNSHLNGPYRTKSTPRALSERGIVWKTFHGPEYSLKFAEMMIRPRM